MTEVPTETVCTECGNITQSRGEYCSSCGAEDSWEEQPQYDFEDVDFPVIVEYEVYEDNYGLWDRFCRQVFDEYGITGEDIANVPGQFPRMKYTVFTTYWKVTESDIEGPFLDEQEARDA